MRDFTIVQRVLNWLIRLYILAIGIWFVFRWVTPGFHWALWAVNELTAFLFLPLPFLLFFAVVFRNKHLLGLLLAPVVVFGVLYGDLFLPRGMSEGPIPGRPVRVMTYNLLNRNQAYGPTLELILGQDADLAGFQEIVLPSAKALSDRLTPQPFSDHTSLPGLDGPGAKRNFDTGLFSRYPIRGYEKLHLPWRDLSWQAFVDLEGVRIRVIVVHLIPTLVREVPVSEWPARIAEREALRQKQVDRVLEVVTAAREPVLVLCDCNFTETSQAYARFTEHLGDSYREAGWGFGNTIHPVGIRLAFERIDYVWHSSQFYVRRATVLRAGTSDHFPVVVDLILMDE